MTRITLPIGTHKTVTTWLQNIPARQREALRAHGVLYLQAGFSTRSTRCTGRWWPDMGRHA